MKYPTRDYRPFKVLLVGSTSKRLPQAWAIAEDAARFGSVVAHEHFPGETVEVVVIRSLTNETIISRLVKG